MPPSTSAPTSPQPIRSPMAKPGGKFSARSTIPPLTPLRSPEASSSALYSSPSVKRSNTIPTSLSVVTSASSSVGGASAPSTIPATR